MGSSGSGPPIAFVIRRINLILRSFRQPALTDCRRERTEVKGENAQRAARLPAALRALDQTRDLRKRAHHGLNVAQKPGLSRPNPQPGLTDGFGLLTTCHSLLTTNYLLLTVSGR